MNSSATLASSGLYNGGSGWLVGGRLDASCQRKKGHRRLGYPTMAQLMMLFVSNKSEHNRLLVPVLFLSILITSPPPLSHPPSIFLSLSLSLCCLFCCCYFAYKRQQLIVWSINIRHAISILACLYIVLSPRRLERRAALPLHSPFLMGV